MKPLRIKSGNQLPAGRYAIVGEKHSFRHFPENGKVTATCDGEWVKFFAGRVNVWECNAVYAAAHFEFNMVIDK